jgi:hypothetical protein
VGDDIMNKEFIRVNTDIIVDASQIIAVRLNSINKTVRKEGYEMWIELPHRNVIVAPDFERNVLNYCGFEIVKSHNDQYILQLIMPDLDY